MSSDEIRARGGCHCGAVRFEIRGPLRDVMICHCADCRRIHGHVGAHTATKWSDLAFTEERGVRWYASSESARRAFCRQCGAGLLFDMHGRDIVSICVGTLDGATGLNTALHIFQGSAADYEAGDGSAPRRQGWPEEGDDVAFR